MRDTERLFATETQRHRETYRYVSVALWFCGYFFLCLRDSVAVVQ
jgi:hypothetical protein